MNMIYKAPVLLLFIMSLGGYLSSEVIKGTYSRKNNDTVDGYYRYTAFVSIACSIILFILSGGVIKASIFTIGMGAIFGLVVTGQIAASSAAMRIGSWSYTSVMMALSTIIPGLSGVLFWGEPFGLVKCIGILFMIICFVLSVQNDEKNEGKKKNNVRWLLFSIVASLSTGGMGIVQKIHQSSVYKNERLSFLIIAFVCAAVFSLVLMSVSGKKQKSSIQKRKILILIFVGAGLATVINHVINLYLSGTVESLLFFPVMSGGEIISVTLTSVIAFKEKLNKKQWTGLICGIFATVILCM